MSFDNLFLVNGVTVNENIRGQAHDLYIEDAIQETTISTAGISAEYGRFTGGVVNLITKSGGNTFSGSFRDSLTNDAWRALTPFKGDSTTDALLSTYEYTLGGPVMRDRLWFFTAGRLQNNEERRTLAVTTVPYDYANTLRRYEGKGTFALRQGQRIEGAYTRFIDEATNQTFSTTTSMDVRSLYNASRRMDLMTVGYAGVITPNLFVEARYSARNENLKNIGSTTRDLVEGTLLIDASSNALRRYWSPTFCGVCDPEDRDNQNVFVKGSFFLSRDGVGSHNVSFGFDSFNDHRFANRHQTGSDYRIYGSGTIVNGGTVTPVFLNNGTTVIQWNPIFVESEGADLRTHSLFLNDNWRVSSRITANIGLRYDRNDGSNSAGDTVADDSSWSPRLGIVWDPTGSQKWAVSGSFAQYVAPITSSVGDASSAAGNPDNYTYVYTGPSINAGGATVSTYDAVDQVFDWFLANGGTNRPYSSGAYPIPIIVSGVSPLIRGSLKSPNVLEYSGGVSRQFGSRAGLRVDLIHRDYRDFYAARTDMTTGQVKDPLNRSVDLTLIENTSDLNRRYLGLNFQGTYRAGTLDLGATYTVSRAWGNVEGENANAGPTADASQQYPEYKQASWNYPEGDLSIDQRHRARLWASYALPWVNGISLSVLQTLESGVPYGAVTTVPILPGFVTNPGYISAPGGATYFFTPRDEFRTEGQKRTDLAANFNYSVRSLGNIQLFGQVQVINLFNQSQLCGCGQGVALSGGGVDVSRIDQSLRPIAPFARFNPFTETPVQGTHWDYSSTFGQAVSRLAYTMPRSLRLSFGVRF
jgi:hypothetical protein